jgi:hypothetical protein
MLWPCNSNSLENTRAAAYAGALRGLHPLFRIDTVRPVLFSGDALPMRAFAAYSYVEIELNGVFLLGGELALPESGWPASAA